MNSRPFLGHAPSPWVRSGDAPTTTEASWAASRALVSVVIPCRNAEPWIGEALASVLSQVGVELEVIVVDDGSEDGSARRVRGIPDCRIKLVEQGQLGASRARTVGTARARGRYIQYVDADDILLPGAVEARVRALEESGADVAYADWVRYERGADGRFHEGKVLARRLGPRPEIDLFTDAWWPPGALLYTRNIVEQIGAWREDLPVIQDARFQLDAALHGARFVHVPSVGLRYRVTGSTSLSRRDPRAFLEDCFRNARDVQRLWEGEGKLESERRRALLWVYGHVARGFFPLDRRRFREVMQQLYSLDPNYRPPHPPLLRLASTLLGYPAAERMAFVWRRLKGLLRG